MRMHFVVVFIIISALISCVSVDRTLLDPSQSGEIFTAEEVKVYFESDEIPEHTRIAILAGKGSDSWTNRNKLITKLREEAGNMGANAIVLGEVKDASTGAKIFLGFRADRKADAIAIYVPSIAKEERVRQ